MAEGTRSAEAMKELLEERNALRAKRANLRAEMTALREQVVRMTTTVREGGRHRPHQSEREGSDEDEFRRAMRIAKPSAPAKYSAGPDQLDVQVLHSWKVAVRSYVIAVVGAKTPSVQVAVAATLLEGAALEWFGTLDPKPENLDDLFAALFARFVHVDVRREARDQLAVLRMKPAESVSQYEATLATLATLAEVGEDYKSECFRRGLLQEQYGMLSHTELLMQLRSEDQNAPLKYDQLVRTVAALDHQRGRGPARGHYAADDQYYGEEEEEEFYEEGEEEVGGSGEAATNLNPSDDAERRHVKKANQPLRNVHAHHPEWQAQLGISNDEMKERLALGTCLACGKRGHGWRQCSSSR